MRRWLPLLLLALAACAGTPKKPQVAEDATVAGKDAAGTATTLPPGCTGKSPYAPAQEDPSTRGHYVAGGLYRPGVKDSTPDYVPNVECIPEPQVVDEPRSPVGNRSPYTVLGKSYHVMERPRGYVEQGTASYYGAKFHGRRTSNQEVYDMYAFSAAHKTLPLPSFARVTNLDNGKSVVVRVNDRGPFHEGRVVDLSYAAAVKLGIVARGTGRVEVRALAPGEAGPPQLATAKSPPTTKADPSPVAATTTVAAAPPTGLDNLVQALPAPEASTGTLSPTPAIAAPAPTGPTTGSFGPAPGPRGAVAPSATAAGVVPAAAVARPAAGPVLQVASFSSLDNARRALDRLVAAGIAGARLDDAVAGGRPLWRLRVAPDGVDAMELASRIAGLGFGMPQLVRE